MNQPSPNPKHASAPDPAPRSTPLAQDRTESRSEGNWTSEHPVNIRLSIPLLFWRFYLVILAGKERRDSNRRAMERQQHPLLKRGNVVALGYGAIIALLALGALVGAAVVILIRQLFEVQIILQ